MLKVITQVEAKSARIDCLGVQAYVHNHISFEMIYNEDKKC